jgi:hypothetical protein
MRQCRGEAIQKDRNKYSQIARTFPGTNESELHGSSVNPVAAAAGH